MLSYMLMKERLVAGCQCAMGAGPRFTSSMAAVHKQSPAAWLCLWSGVSWSLSIRPRLHVPQHSRGGWSLLGLQGNESFFLETASLKPQLRSKG